VTLAVSCAHAISALSMRCDGGVLVQVKECLEDRARLVLEL